MLLVLLRMSENDDGVEKCLAGEQLRSDSSNAKPNRIFRNNLDDKPIYDYIQKGIYPEQRMDSVDKKHREFEEDNKRNTIVKVRELARNFLYFISFDNDKRIVAHSYICAFIIAASLFICALVFNTDGADWYYTDFIMLPVFSLYLSCLFWVNVLLEREFLKFKVIRVYNWYNVALVVVFESCIAVATIVSVPLKYYWSSICCRVAISVIVIIINLLTYSNAWYINSVMDYIIDTNKRTDKRGSELQGEEIDNYMKIQKSFLPIRDQLWFVLLLTGITLAAVNIVLINFKSDALKDISLFGFIVCSFLITMVPSVSMVVDFNTKASVINGIVLNYYETFHGNLGERLSEFSIKPLSNDRAPNCLRVHFFSYEPKGDVLLGTALSLLYTIGMLFKSGAFF